MTTSDLIDYYQNLLILEYIGKPNARGVIAAVVGPVIMDQLPILSQDSFTIGQAVGAQLDVIGKYAGVTRLGQGFLGVVNLNDADFTQLITLAIIKNNSFSSLANIQSLLNQYFPNQIMVFDYLGMRMSYYINASVGSPGLAELFVSEGILPKPMGVQLGATIYFPVINRFFGFRTYASAGANITPFNNYSSYNMNSPWLSYQMAVGVGV